MTVLNIHVTTQLKCHVTFGVGPPHPNLAPYQVLGAMGLVFNLSRSHDIEVSRVFVGWSTLLYRYPARFGVHRLNRTGNNGVCSISSNSNSNAEVYK